MTLPPRATDHSPTGALTGPRARSVRLGLHGLPFTSIRYGAFGGKTTAVFNLKIIIKLPRGRDFTQGALSPPSMWPWFPLGAPSVRPAPTS